MLFVFCFLLGSIIGLLILIYSKLIKILNVVDVIALKHVIEHISEID